MQSLRIEKLASHHAIDSFDCGESDLNRFLLLFALQNQRANASQTYVAVSGTAIVGYYTLVVGDVDFEQAPERMRKGLARYPVPIMVLARLAVDLSWQGKGIGGGLLKDSLKRTLLAADIAGVRSFVVHAKNTTARDFYLRMGFAEGLTDPLHLYVLIKDAKLILS